MVSRFCGAMNLELKENKNDLIYEKEYNLIRRGEEAGYEGTAGKDKQPYTSIWQGACGFRIGGKHQSK